MRFSRFSSAVRCGCTTRCTCFAAGARFLPFDFISGVFDCRAQPCAVHAPGDEIDFGLSRMERDVGAFHAIDAFEHAFHTRNAALAGHAFDADRDRFHVNLLQLTGFQRLSSSELLTTDTDESAIAPPAMTGFSMPSAA